MGNRVKPCTEITKYLKLYGWIYAIIQVNCHRHMGQMTILFRQNDSLKKQIMFRVRFGEVVLDNVRTQDIYENIIKKLST